MKSVNSSIPITGYASKTCWIIGHIPYNLIFTIKFNNSSTLTTIISCDYFSDKHMFMCMLIYHSQWLHYEYIIYPLYIFSSMLFLYFFLYFSKYVIWFKFYEITSFGGRLRLINSEAVMKSVNPSIPITGYASKTYSL
jgi:membrane glycosyltransferase